MRRYFIIFSIIVLGIAFSQEVFLNSLFALIFLGEIPGTNIVLPFWVMFSVSIIISLALIRWLLGQPLYIGSIPRQEQTARNLARKKIVSKRHTTSTRRTRAKKYRTAAAKTTS